ncbi:hypothetical protein SAMN04487886_12381 [Clostridium sp. DSM 8431]|uniref:tetratricopeptide repeat protein n=1 Tax=Clostridium sp. DSM 8431 TaxID=1761781 RepID=UPI0008E42754|nr:tetratricopeptide repeat protein [Clostridium sp. DSM 8431]SFU86468.1 hypothetical protein SAMN04487886_12381 [Clostridium sp. DSM 8431]
MGKLQVLFGKKETDEAKEVEIVKNTNNEEFIECVDARGKRIQMSSSKWKTEVIPAKLKAAWNNATVLYEEIMNAVNDGFPEEVVKAAEHLQEIDEVKERSATALGIVYLRCNRISDSEKVLNGYIAENGKSSIILTNLAKAYDAEGEKEKSVEALEEAIELNPNETSAVIWYGAYYQEKDGVEASIKALENLVEKYDSWVAKLLLARNDLEAKNIRKVMKTYREILDNNEATSAMLSAMSSDLGNCGYIKEVIKILEPSYDYRKHSVDVGLNLLHAYYEDRNNRKGLKLIQQLMEVPDPSLRDFLVHMAHEFDKLRAIKEFEGDKGNIKINMVSLDKPIWYYDLENPDFLIKKKTKAEKIAIIPYVDLTKHTEEPELFKADGAGTLTRTVPLYLSEQLMYKSEYDSKVVIPFAEKYGPVAVTEEYTEEALQDICKKVKADKLITGSIKLANENKTYVITNLIYNAEDDSIQKIIYDCDDNCFGEDFNDMINDIREHLGKEIENDTFYKTPEDDDVLVYLTALGQQLTQTFISHRYLSKEGFEGDSEMYNWYFNMALANPNDEVALIMVASALAKSKEYGSKMADRVKRQVIGLFTNRSDESIAKKLLPLIYKFYELESDFEREKEKINENCKDKKVLKWLEGLEDKVLQAK